MRDKHPQVETSVREKPKKVLRRCATLEAGDVANYRAFTKCETPPTPHQRATTPRVTTLGAFREPIEPTRHSQQRTTALQKRAVRRQVLGLRGFAQAFITNGGGSNEEEADIFNVVVPDMAT